MYICNLYILYIIYLYLSLYIYNIFCKHYAIFPPHRVGRPAADRGRFALDPCPVISCRPPGNPYTAEAKKVEVASVLAHLIPNPPFLTGSVAWIHCVSSRSTLRMVESPSLKTASNFSICECLK